MTARVYRLLVAAALAIAPVAVLGSSRRRPTRGGARAGTGVTVVVDYGALGGGVQIACDRGGAGDPVSEVSPRAGYPLATSPTSRLRLPSRASPDPPQASCGRTPPSNAYWGLFWSDGSPASWTYSSEGAALLEGAGRRVHRLAVAGRRRLDRPGASPPAHPPSASPRPARHRRRPTDRVEKPRGRRARHRRRPRRAAAPSRVPRPPPRRVANAVPRPGTARPPRPPARARTSERERRRPDSEQPDRRGADADASTSPTRPRSRSRRSSR